MSRDLFSIFYLHNRLEESRTKALLVKSFAYKDDDDNVTREESDEPEADQDQDGDREESRSSEELYQSDSDHYNEEVEEDVKEERSVDEYEDDDYEKESLSSHSSNPSAIDEDIPYESDLDWMILLVKYFNLYQITIPKFYVGTLPYLCTFRVCSNLQIQKCVDVPMEMFMAL